MFQWAGGTLRGGKERHMIDIVRDYTAIGMGSAQATTNRVLGAAHSSARWVTTWGHPELVGEHAEAHPGLMGSVARAPGALVSHVQGEIDCVVQRLGLVSESDVRALRHQVQRLERHISDLRGDR
jgi:polyhydroxyalkanoate synthesis regulator phasin